jgi:hypothetical protein
MQLTGVQRGYLLVGQVLVPILINLVLNGAIGFAMFRGASAVPLFGSQSILGDTLGTSFFLPAITCLIVTPIVRGHVRKGAAEPLRGALPGWLAFFRRALVPRALALGLAGVVLAGSLALVLFTALGVESLAFTPFVAFKAVFAGLLGGIVTPLIALLALADRPPA